MTKESQKLFILAGIFAALAVIGLFYLKNRDRLASNHYKYQALKKCDNELSREDCEAGVEKRHQGCYQAFIVDREGDVDRYARCMGMSDEKFDR
jgi:hypothetical protein